MVRGTLAGVALVGVGLAACVQTGTSSSARVITREETFRPTVQAGRELRVFTYARTSRDCTPREAPQIQFRSQPEHGTVSLRPGMGDASVRREGAVDCSSYGRIYPGTSVYYQPVPGFRGTDRFDYDVLSPTSRSHDTVIVEVR